MFLVNFGWPTCSSIWTDFLGPFIIKIAHFRICVELIIPNGNMLSMCSEDFALLFQPVKNVLLRTAQGLPSCDSLSIALILTVILLIVYSGYWIDRSWARRGAQCGHLQRRLCRFGGWRCLARWRLRFLLVWQRFSISRSCSPCSIYWSLETGIMCVDDGIEDEGLIDDWTTVRGWSAIG